MGVAGLGAPAVSCDGVLGCGGRGQESGGAGSHHGETEVGLRGWGVRASSPQGGLQTLSRGQSAPPSRGPEGGRAWAAASGEGAATALA